MDLHQILDISSKKKKKLAATTITWILKVDVYYIKIYHKILLKKKQISKCRIGTHHL